MTISEYFKLQARFLEWEAPNGFCQPEHNTREVLWAIAGVKIGESGVRT